MSIGVIFLAFRVFAFWVLVVLLAFCPFGLMSFCCYFFGLSGFGLLGSGLMTHTQLEIPCAFEKLKMTYTFEKIKISNAFEKLKIIHSFETLKKTFAFKTISMII